MNINFQFVTIIVMFATLLWQIIGYKKVARYTLFAEYTKRYQEIMLALPEDLGEETAFENKEKSYLRAYFDLCSEEYFLHKKGNLNKEVWKEWKEGMKIAFNKKAIFDYWQEKKTCYEDFNKFVEKELIKK